MKITHIIKRDYETSFFELEKITNAIERAMISVNNGTKEDAAAIANIVHGTLLERKLNEPNYTPTVEQVQDIVEEKLMDSPFHDVAKAYILYRDEQARSRKRNIFEKRLNLKPYEYPALYEYVNAIRHSYWIHTEFNYNSDIQDFKIGLTDVDRHAIKNTMLAIYQIEVAVKSVWGDIYKRMTNTEISLVVDTFSEGAVRHHDAFLHLL